jgi:elongation factor Ts
MEISASDVKLLREKTGAGMMDCKKALAESGGDFEKAIDFLRKKGAATAEKRMDRNAREGVVLTKVEDGNGYIVEVNCETDFVARSADFLAFAGSVLDTVVATRPADVAALLATAVDGKSVAERLTEFIGKIGEKMEIKRVATFDRAAVLVDYIHPGSKLGVMIELADAAPSDETRALARDLAMQIAAMNPIAIDRSAVPAAVREKEMEIYRQQARDMGKPEQMIDRIAEGKLNKFYQEFTLLEQSYIRDNTITVKEHVAAVAKAQGRELSVKRFVRFQVGEAQ